MKIRELPPDVVDLCARLKVPPALKAHLECVHDAAVTIVSRLRKLSPGLKFDDKAVVFGAATHDIGKVAFPNEITGPGNQHEEAGPRILEEVGVPKELARFAHTHGARAAQGGVEDMLVALADATWKGKRSDGLEDALAQRLVADMGIDPWKAAWIVGELAEAAGEKASDRVAYSRGR